MRSETEPTSGTNKENSHGRYLIITECPIIVGIPDVDLYLRARIDACEPTLSEGSWYPGDITGQARLGVRDHDFIGTSQTTRDICSRTADALTNKSLSLSLRARDRTTPHACDAPSHTRTWESKNPATSVRKFVRRRICWLARCRNDGNFVGTPLQHTCANNRSCCRDCVTERHYQPWLTYVKPALTSRSSSQQFFIVICIATSRSEIINEYM